MKSTVDILTASGEVRCTIKLNKGAKGKFSLMKEDYITLPFSSKDPIPFEVGDYVDLRSQFDENLGGQVAKIYMIVKLSYPAFKNGVYKYELRLDAYYWDWNRFIFKYTPSNPGREASWSLTANLAIQLDVLLQNLKALGYLYNGTEYSYFIDDSVSTEALAMTYDNIHLLDALFEMAKKANCECWIQDSVIYFGRCEFQDPVRLEVGISAQDITRSESSNEFATRIYAFGSTKNIPSNYRPIEDDIVVNGVVQRRLMLPADTPFVDSKEGLPASEVVEAIVTFDNIYPRRIGKLDSVSVYSSSVETEEGVFEEDFYRFTDNGIVFLQEYILPSQELKIKFESGNLNGMEFSVIFNPAGEHEKNSDGSINKAAQLWEIVKNDNYGRSLPDNVLFPKVGDSYVLSGFDSSKIEELGLIDAAEKELLEETRKFVARSSNNDGTYNVPLRSSWVSADFRSRNYEIGQRVELVNPAYFKEPRLSRIIGFEIKLDIPADSPQYTVGESISYSRLSDIENKVTNITFKGQTFVSGAGSGGVYIISTRDVTPPTDRNVYSALATEALFLSKKKGGNVEGDTTFKKRVKIAESLITEDFEEDAFAGRGFGVTKDADSNSVVTTDILKVRMKAIFSELVINQTTFERGRTIFSAAGCEITSVEVLDDVYRCYYDNKDGKRFSGFAVGDQARCQRYDASYNGITKMYWRVVKAVGENYVDLFISGTDSNGLLLSQGNDAPEAGDNIVLFGNRRDKNRQSFIVIASTPDPTILQYVGVNSFTLPDPVTKISPYENEFTGKVHIGAGSSGIENIEGLPKAIQDIIGDMDFDIDVDSLEFGKYNLLRNSGFTGDYLSAQLQSGKVLNTGSQLFSPNLEYWDVSNVSAQESSLSESGVEAIITNGSLSQTLKNKIIVGENYVASFKAKGTSLTFSVGGVSRVVALTDEYTRYVEKFTASSSSNVFTISASNATICEVQLERGTVVSAWGHSMWDNQSELAYYQSLQYLASAMKDGSTDILGGLILSNILWLGNYANGQMKQVTAGVSGVYNDDDDVAIWAGGDMTKAIATVLRFRDNPNILPSDKDWKEMVNFVATHGGDVFMRGYIHALGGIFSGSVKIAGGKILLNADGSGAMANGAFSWDTNGRITRYYPEREYWIDLKDATSMSHDEGGFFLSPLKKPSEDVEPISDDGSDALVVPTPTLSPYVFCIKGQDGDARSGYESKPFATDYFTTQGGGQRRVKFKIHQQATSTNPTIPTTIEGYYLDVTVLPNRGVLTVEYNSTPEPCYTIILPTTMTASLNIDNETIVIL